MDNQKTSGRSALRTIDDVFHESLEVVKKELNKLHTTIRGNEERIKSDAEFIANQQAQIKILNNENYQIKAERDDLRSEIKKLSLMILEKENLNNTLIIFLGLIFVSAVIVGVSNYLSV